MYRQPALEKPFVRWLSGGGPLAGRHSPKENHPWYLVLWLTGVDYFSTLGYQPGIALLAAGTLAPLSTAILVAVTLLGALPVYSQVASRSYAGQGSIAMLENLLPGWAGKLFVLVLLGFAGTDFIITMTLSAADAAQHAIENPYLNPYLGEHRIYLTVGPACSPCWGFSQRIPRGDPFCGGRCRSLPLAESHSAHPRRERDSPPPGTNPCLG